MERHYMNLVIKIIFMIYLFIYYNLDHSKFSILCFLSPRDW